MASTYLSKTFSSGTTKKWTFSCWIKRSNIANAQTLFYASPTANSNFESIGFTTSGDLDWEHYEYTTSSYKGRLKTNRLFRDVGAWMHIVCVFDSANATAGDRMRLYVNGTEETSFQTDTNPSLNQDAIINGANPHTVASYGASQYFDGSMTHIHFTDGYAYAATDFGESDSTSGIWKPKTAPSVTYGTNGFFLKFENSGAMGTDSSGNTNTFTVNGTITQTEDTPSNNFATWNPVSNPRIASGTAYLPTFSNGNTTVNQANATYYTGTKSSIGVSAGKWYLEAKCSAVGSQAFIGLAPDDDYGEIQETYLYENDGQINGSAYGNTYTTGDIIQIAFDADNGAVWFGKNGTWENSATQSEIEAGTTTNAGITGLSMTKFYHFATKGYNGSTFQANFGNGKFGTTSLASSNSDGAGLGLFEYSVPSGYYSLCTKNIKDYG